MTDMPEMDPTLADITVDFSDSSVSELRKMLFNPLTAQAMIERLAEVMWETLTSEGEDPTEWAWGAQAIRHVAHAIMGEIPNSPEQPRTFLPDGVQVTPATHWNHAAACVLASLRVATDPWESPSVMPEEAQKVVTSGMAFLDELMDVVQFVLKFSGTVISANAPDPDERWGDLQERWTGGGNQGANPPDCGTQTP